LLAGQDMRARITERRREAAEVRRWHLPAFIDAARLDEVFTAAPEVAGSRILRGTPLSAGYGEGRIWIGGSSDALRNEGVLVCDALDPSLVPMLAGTVAVMVQQGGTLSH